MKPKLFNSAGDVPVVSFLFSVGDFSVGDWFCTDLDLSALYGTEYWRDYVYPLKMKDLLPITCRVEIILEFERLRANKIEERPFLIRFEFWFPWLNDFATTLKEKHLSVILTDVPPHQESKSSRLETDDRILYLICFQIKSLSFLFKSLIEIITA